MNFRIALGALAVAAAISTPAFAESPWYAGLSVGQSSTKFNSDDFSGSGLSESQDKTDTAVKINGGYKFNTNFAAEVGYVDLGKATYSYSATGLQANDTTKHSSWYVAVKGILPVSNQFDLFGKLGVTQNHAKDSVTLNGTSIWNGSDTRTDAYYGLGVQYHLNKQVSFVGEYENFGKFGDTEHTGRTKVDMFSIGVQFNF